MIYRPEKITHPVLAGRRKCPGVCQVNIPNTDLETANSAIQGLRRAGYTVTYDELALQSVGSDGRISLKINLSCPWSPVNQVCLSEFVRGVNLSPGLVIPGCKRK